MSKPGVDGRLEVNADCTSLSLEDRRIDEIVILGLSVGESHLDIWKRDSAESNRDSYALLLGHSDVKGDGRSKDVCSYSTQW